MLIYQRVNVFQNLCFCLWCNLRSHGGLLFSECPTCAEFHGESIPPYKLGVTSPLYSIHIHVYIIDTLFMWFFHWLIFSLYKYDIHLFIGLCNHTFIHICIYIYGYGSIPIHTIFRGMNIHLPAILMFTRGIGFWPIPIYIYIYK